MAVIKKQHALDRLANAVKAARTDDLIEIYNELFPDKPTTEDEAAQKPGVIVGKVLAHFDTGLEVEEILALWNIIFPMHREVWFDEEEGLIHYDEKANPMAQVY